MSQHSPSPHFLVGIDGGGSSTRAHLTDAVGRWLGQGRAGPSSLRLGPQAAWQAVETARVAAFRAAGIEPAAVAQCAIGLGLAGVGVPAQTAAFLQAAPPFARLVLDSDAIAAVLGAHGGAAGVVVASGTGSVGAALGRDGSRRLIGGWGFPVGDEGSGAWLGLRAMQHTHHVADGQYADGALARAVRAVAGTDRQTLLDWCAGADAQRYAALAPLVFDAAAEDPAAEALLARAAQALQALALALDLRAELPLALMGSIGERLAPRFGQATRSRLTAPLGDAAEGAWRLVAPGLQRTRIRPPAG